MVEVLLQYCASASLVSFPYNRKRKGTIHGVRGRTGASASRLILEFWGVADLEAGHPIWLADSGRTIIEQFYDPERFTMVSPSVCIHFEGFEQQDFTATCSERIFIM